MKSRFGYLKVSFNHTQNTRKLKATILI